jgi:uncharacterized protein YbaP (TraB family)
MIKAIIWCLAVVMVAGAATPVWSGNSADAAAGATGVGPATEEIDVIGTREGPRMWRITRGDHELWILGTLAPLPNKMVWQSTTVETVLAQSQEVISGSPSIGINAGPFAALRLYLQWRKVQTNPQRSTLKDTLPAPMYARFAALKNRFAPRDSRIDELRPIFAALRLYDRAIEASNLTRHNDIQQMVLKLARKLHVSIYASKLTVDDPAAVLKDFGNIPIDAELACFDSTLSSLETDLGTMQLRASAWARGDVDTLRRLPYVDEESICVNAVSSSARVSDLIARARDAWLEEAENALTRNHSTMALQRMSQLLGPTGLLESLRAKGYRIEGP